MTQFSLQFHYQKTIFKTLPVKSHHLKTLGSLIQKFLPVPPKGKILLNIVDFETMQEIIKTYYPFKTTTDVLSFPHTNNLKITDANVIIGEVYLAFEQSKKQAQQHGHSWLRESCYLLVHGIFHLLGYDHKTVPDKQLMRYWEEFFITQKLAITR